MPPDAETVSVAEAPRVTLDGVAEKLEMIGPPLEGSTVREVVVVALRAALSFTKTRTVKVPVAVEVHGRDDVSEEGQPEGSPA